MYESIRREIYNELQRRLLWKSNSYNFFRGFGGGVYVGKLMVRGGERLKGEIIVEGSKNAVLPILAATVLNKGISVIKNSPDLDDVKTMIEILQDIGCKITRETNKLIIDSSTINKTEISEELAQKMRSSIVMMGGMLARFGEVKISYPGGCELGPRPINIHLKAMRAMGVEVHEALHGFIQCKAAKLKGCDIVLDYPSVGATENIMIAACTAEGKTYIRNAAKEPEIIDLQSYLKGIGAKISGAGTSIICIEGTKGNFKDIEHTVIQDRIVAGTYLVASAITGGNLVLNRVIPDQLIPIVHNLKDAGSIIEVQNDSICINGPERPIAIETIRTLPYPGFPTDMQAQMVSLLSIAEGTSIVVETVFEKRYKHIDELVRMGANINQEGSIAVIKGVKKLAGANVVAKDLRGGAALVLAGLVAEGSTIINGTNHIDRGYEEIEKKLSQVGAKILRIN